MVYDFTGQSEATRFGLLPIDGLYESENIRCRMQTDPTTGVDKRFNVIITVKLGRGESVPSIAISDGFTLGKGDSFLIRFLNIALGRKFDGKKGVDFGKLITEINAKNPKLTFKYERPEVDENGRQVKGSFSRVEFLKAFEIPVELAASGWAVDSSEFNADEDTTGTDETTTPVVESGNMDDLFETPADAPL